MRPFRYGVNAWRARSRAEWAEKVRKAKDLRYPTLTVPDRLADYFPPMLAVLSAAEATKQLRVGTNLQRVVVTDDRRWAAKEVTGRWTQLTPDAILQSPCALIGTVDQIVEDLRARRKRSDIGYYIVFEPYLDDFGPAVARLAGQWTIKIRQLNGSGDGATLYR